MPVAVRGVTPLSHGDTTGAIHRANIDQKADREKIIRQTVADLLGGDDVVIVAIPGGRSHAVSREVVRYLRADK